MRRKYKHKLGKHDNIFYASLSIQNNSQWHLISWQNIFTDSFYIGTIFADFKYIYYNYKDDATYCTLFQSISSSSPVIKNAALSLNNIYYYILYIIISYIIYFI